MKIFLGLDLGTNSIGWALVGEEGTEKKIIGIGSRIIPMGQDVLGKFDSGQSVSQTAERTEVYADSGRDIFYDVNACIGYSA